MIDFGKKRVLIIDDSPAMCSSLRMTLSNFGITRSEMSNAASEALFRIRNREFDMIVCDYNLGSGTDGQQLLEYLRKNNLIAPATVFLMVTAERSYEKVVLCAEMAPDDYLLKPFTAETMRVRVDRIFQRKETFLEIYTCLARGQIEEALAECDRLLAERSRYSVDLMRMKGELLLELGREEDARQMYEVILQTRAVPWARLGLAKAMRGAGDAEAAALQLQVVIEEMPEYLPAYDLLAKVQQDQGNSELAQSSLEMALKISPGNLARQSSLGEVAYRNGDLSTATRAFSTVVGNGRQSFLRSHEDFVNLGRVQMEQNQFDQAIKTVEEARSAFGGTPEVELAVATMETLIHHQANNPAAAAEALDRALAARKASGLNLSDQVAVDLAKACFISGRENEARELVKDMVSNFYEDVAVQQSVRKMLESVGRGDEGKALIEDSVAGVIKLNNEGVLRARQGDLAGAVRLLLEAATQMPQNVQLALNAAQAIIVESDRNGWNEERMRMAKYLLDQNEAKHSKLLKFIKIKNMLKDVGAKFGVNMT